MKHSTQRINCTCGRKLYLKKSEVEKRVKILMNKYFGVKK